MKRRQEGQEEEKTCEICGSMSFPDYVLTCSQCGVREHDYCSPVPLSKDHDPWHHEAWTCERCRAKNGSSVLRNSKRAKFSGPSNFSQLNQDFGMRTNRSRGDLSRQADQRGKVMLLSTNEVVRLEKARLKPSVPSIISSRPCQINHPVSAQSPRLTSKKSEYFRMRPSVQVNRNSHQGISGPAKTSRDGSGSKSHHRAMRVPEDKRDETILVQQATMNLSKELPIETGPTSADTGGFGSSIEAKSMGKASPIPSLLGHLHKSRYSPSRYHEPGTGDAALAPDDPAFEFIRCHSYFPSSDASWTGRFKFSSSVAPSKYYGAFKAYSPARALRKAYEFSGFIPDNLHVELIPEGQLLLDSKIFKRSPDFDDIALYFYPDVQSDSSYRDYVYLRELMKNQDYAIRGSIVDDIEILIFTSKHLPLDAEWLKTDLFLWGVFYDAKNIPRNLPVEISPRDSWEEPDRNPAPKAERPMEWTPPSTGWVKLNTTAISRGGVAGIGGSVHGPLGKWIFGYVLNLGQDSCTQLRADLWALLYGLKLVSERGYKKVQVETDSQQALDCLKTNPDESDPNADFIGACRKLLVGNWQVSQSLVTRERNRPAILVVNDFESHHMGVLTLIDSPPPDLAGSTEDSQVGRDS